MTEGKEVKYPNLDTFSQLSLQDKVGLFTSLPVSSQKLLIGCSAFASTVNPEMAKVVSKLTPEEYETAKSILLQTPYFLILKGRLQIAEPIKNFVNTDLKKIWEEQKKIK